jgi:quercetin dioxygenase-like cupin family protein
MKAMFTLLALALPLAAASAQDPMSSPAPATQPATAHVMYDANTLKWGPAPPAFEPGAQVAVLAGDPGQPGVFALRLKIPAGFKIARHWHPTDERVTVLEGDFTLDMGEGASKHSHTFGPGGYAVLPAKMQHAGSTSGGATLQVAGMGPFVLNYVDPKDDPRLRAKK